MNIFIHSIILGLLSTLIMDLLALLRFHFFQSKSFNYALIGRWTLSLKNFKFLYNNITSSPVVKYEMIVGWLLHYAIGVSLSFIYLQTPIFNEQPNIFISSILFGLFTTLIPLIIMQPILGFGFFASKTPRPTQSIKNSLIAHFNFGLGLFLAQYTLFKLF